MAWTNRKEKPVLLTDRKPDHPNRSDAKLSEAGFIFYRRLSLFPAETKADARTSSNDEYEEESP
jgi:hypothetical protein